MMFGMLISSEEEHNSMFKKLLVPVDGSRWSNRAVDAAIELAQCHEASVLLLHAIRDLSLPKEILQMIATGEVTASRTQILQDSAEIILEHAQKRFTEAGLTEVQGEYVIGDPASKILEYGKQNDVDLIVLGHRGLGPHGGLLGGVARKLVNMTEISVLIVT